MLKDPRWAAINFDGTPASGAKMFVYQSGTDILAELFSDKDLTVRLENPLIADGFGYFPVAHAATGSYKVRIESSRGVLMGQVDGVEIE